MESKGAGHSSRQKSSPSISTTLFAKSIGALDIHGITHVLVIITLELFRVILFLSGKQIAKNLSNAIANKLRIEQQEQTCWQKGKSLHSVKPMSPDIHSSVSFISTKRDSGMLITVVQRSAIAMLTIKEKATFLSRRFRRVTVIISIFPVKDTVIMITNAAILATFSRSLSFSDRGQL